MDKELHDKYEGIIFGPWKIYDDDFKQNHGNTETCYGQVNFGKSDDKCRFACVYAFYTAEMKFAEVIVKKDHPYLWGLINLPTFVYEQPPLSIDVIEKIHEYFRYRALHGFLVTGVISKINWVD